MYCGIFFNKLAKHVKGVHPQEAEVKELLKILPDKRLIAMAKIRKHGMFHNLAMINTNGPILTERKYKAKDFMMCVKCKAFFI